jgi:hypothetical protein
MTLEIFGEGVRVELAAGFLRPPRVQFCSAKYIVRNRDCRFHTRSITSSKTNRKRWKVTAKALEKRPDRLTFIYVGIPAYRACFLDTPPSIFHSVQNPVVLQTYFGFLFLEKACYQSVFTATAYAFPTKAGENC